MHCLVTSSEFGLIRSTEKHSLESETPLSWPFISVYKQQLGPRVTKSTYVKRVSKTVSLLVYNSLIHHAYDRSVISTKLQRCGTKPGHIISTKTWLPFIYLITVLSFIQALAALINVYVAALNTPGTVPSVQSAWETFVHTKCSEAKVAALQVYQSYMESQLDGVLPCDSDEIRLVQQTAIEESMRLFQGETFGVSATSSEKYLDELTVRKKGRIIFSTVQLHIHAWICYECEECGVVRAKSRYM